MQAVQGFFAGLAILLGLIGGGFGLIGALSRTRKSFAIVAVIVTAAAAVFLSVLGMAYSELATAMVIKEMGKVDPMVSAPAHAGAWASLWVGFFVASGLMALMMRRLATVGALG